MHYVFLVQSSFHDPLALWQVQGLYGGLGRGLGGLFGGLVYGNVGPRSTFLATCLVMCAGWAICAATQQVVRYSQRKQDKPEMQPLLNSWQRYSISLVSPEVKVVYALTVAALLSSSLQVITFPYEEECTRVCWFHSKCTLPQNITSQSKLWYAKASKDRYFVQNSGFACFQQDFYLYICERVIGY